MNIALTVTRREADAIYAALAFWAEYLRSPSVTTEMTRRLAALLPPVGELVALAERVRREAAEQARPGPADWSDESARQLEAAGWQHVVCGIWARTVVGRRVRVIADRDGFGADVLNTVRSEAEPGREFPTEAAALAWALSLDERSFG